jgi:hypothetical protein
VQILLNIVLYKRLSSLSHAVEYQQVSQWNSLREVGTNIHLLRHSGIERPAAVRNQGQETRTGDNYCYPRIHHREYYH